MKNQEKKVFHQINLILNKEQSKKIMSHIFEFMKGNLFPEKKGDFFSVYNEKLENHVAGSNTLSFNPEKREFKVSLSDRWALNFKSNQEKISLNLISPKGNKINIHPPLSENYFIKFNCNFHSIAIVTAKRQTSLMLFDTRNFKMEKDMFTFSSLTDFNLYINKDLYKKTDSNERKNPEPAGYSSINSIETAMDLLPIEILSIEVGRNLLTLVDPLSGAKLIERMNSVRKFIALESGIIIPPVYFKDNLQLKHNSYIIKVKGVEVAGGEVIPDRLLAIGPENTLKNLDGTRCSDPVYSMPAIWIEEEQKNKAEPVCMVFDAVSVIATQFTEVTRSHAAELLGVDEVSSLLEILKKSHPFLIREVYPARITLGEIQKILKNLLREKVSIRDLPAILETINNHADSTKNSDLLTEYVRDSLCNFITKEYQLDGDILTVMTVDKKIENIILRGAKASERSLSINLSPLLARKILDALQEGLLYMRQKGFYPVIVCSPPVRPYLRKLTERVFPELIILSSSNISPKIKVNYLKTINLSFLPVEKIIRKIRNIYSSIMKTITKHSWQKINFIKKNEDKKITEEEIDYMCLRLDITREEAVEVLNKHDKESAPMIELKEQLNVTEGEHTLMEEKVETLISWLEIEVSNKIKKIIQETGVSSYEAFMALNETKGDVEGSINIIKSSSDPAEEQNGEYKYNDYHHLLFEPEIWQKLDYIMSETLCNLSEAFKTLIEFQEDEEVAAKVIMERKKQS